MQRSSSLVAIVWCNIRREVRRSAEGVCRRGEAIYHVAELVRLKEWWRGLEGERERLAFPDCPYLWVIA